MYNINRSKIIQNEKIQIEIEMKMIITQTQFICFFGYFFTSPGFLVFLSEHYYNEYSLYMRVMGFD